MINIFIFSHMIIINIINIIESIYNSIYYVLKKEKKNNNINLELIFKHSNLSNYILTEKI